MSRLTAKTADKTILLTATLFLAGKAYNVPSKTFWDDVLNGRPYLLLTFLVVAGVFGAFTPFESWRRRSFVDRNVMMRRRVLSTFGRLLEISAEIDPHLDTGDLALHVWRRRRTPRHPVHGVLKRLSSYRMSSYPATRAFSPTRGVGAVGLCWQLDREVSFDVTALVESLDSEAKFDDHVDRHGSETVMNLTWDEFKDFNHRTALFVTPIRSGRNKFVGCVSVDSSGGYSVLNERELFEEMTNLGMAIGREDFECT